MIDEAGLHRPKRVRKGEKGVAGGQQRVEGASNEGEGRARGCHEKEERKRERNSERNVEGSTVVVVAGGS